MRNVEAVERAPLTPTPPAGAPPLVPRVGSAGKEY
jgi:hypothetical protein